MILVEQESESGPFEIAGLRHKFVATREVRLHLVEAGPEEGEPVILLHGFPEFWYGWRHQIRGLAELGFHAVAPDQRGYNLSDKPEGVDAYRVDNLAGDVLGLMDALGWESANLAGHDWGAAVAWQVALTRPERVRRLAILNVPHPDVMVQFLRNDWRQRFNSWYIYFFQIPRIPEALLMMRGCAGLLRMMRTSGADRSFSDSDWQFYLEAWTQPGALTAMINWYRAAFQSGWKEVFRPPSNTRTVSTRTLIIWGKKDVALRVEMAQASLRCCPDGRLILHEDASHWVQHDQALPVTQELAEFFRA